jgi:ABC-type multidrug transport system fused ATPase/permease subunit
MSAGCSTGSGPGRRGDPRPAPALRQDVRFEQHSLRERFAFVPQDPWLLDATVAENIAFGNSEATRPGVLAAGLAALVDEFVDRLPFGYDTALGEGGIRLSGGQRRRVAIARAAVPAGTDGVAG